MIQNARLEMYDVAVAGAGPAGLLAAAAAARRGFSVCVVEREEQFPRKLLITGKGRCNLTNACDSETFFDNVRCGAKFLRSAYSAFSADDIMRHIEALGVPLKIERGRRVFPQSERAADIADALVRDARAAGCSFVTARASGVRTESGAVAAFSLVGGGEIRCRSAIIATGGLSYPQTGSTGDGLRIANALGHSIIDPRPSLVPLVCGGEDCANLQGLSLKNIALTLEAGGRTLFREQGELIFTHFGISGPLVLSASARLVGQAVVGARATIDLKPALDEKTLDRRLLRDFAEQLNREFKNALGELLPSKLIPIVVMQSGIDPTKKINSITAKERAALIGVLKGFELNITDTRPIEEAVITAGGVSTKEIDPKTMMSKKIKNLHFAGEVLDADGYTGGFNLGIAFATGHAAGSHILEEESR